jgi:SAM-dependent methyltransferase
MIMHTFGIDAHTSGRARMDAPQMFIFYLRTARNKARPAATAEALALLRDLDATAPSGGPLSEQGGLFWIAVPQPATATAIERFPRLGYTCAVDAVEPVEQSQAEDDGGEDVRLTRWRRKPYRLRRVYEEDAEALRERAPDRRTFLLQTDDGVVREIQGYRGDGGPLSRRGLPVYDARLLVNLVSGGAGSVFLDPFAGIGGLVIEAVEHQYRVTSVDIDPAIRYGLLHLSTRHCVADAAHLPFTSASIDAIATEPPYHDGAMPTVLASLREMARVLKDGGRLAVLCAASQADTLRAQAATLPLAAYLDAAINRKGLDVVVLAWQRMNQDERTIRV